MAQQVKLMGVTYSNAPSIMLPDANGVLHSFDDTSDADAIAGDITTGKTAYVNGVKLTGTNSGGGGSSWTKIAETTYTTSYSSTSSAVLAELSTGHPEIWTSNKILYIKIRDTEGRKAGHFYGVDAFFTNIYPANTNATQHSVSTGLITNTYSCASNTTNLTCRYGYTTTGYGVFPSMVSDSGTIRFSQRYNSSYSRTIDGTYKVEVYLLDPAGDAPIFD